MSSKENRAVVGCALISLISIIMLIGCVAVTGKTSENTSTEETTPMEHNTEFEDSFSVGLNPSRDYLILVNGSHGYEFGGEYDKALQRDLIYVANTNGEPTLVEKGAYLAFSQLKRHLLDNGIEIELYDAYRTKADQAWRCDQYNDFSGELNTETPVDVPGYSEHHTGLLLFIRVRQLVGEPGRQVWTTEFTEAQSDNPAFKAVHENLADFGFITRYPADKEELTGCPYRPYEIRFVGSSRVAHEIADGNMCLEEYLGNK